MTAYYEDLEALKHARVMISEYGLEVQDGFRLLSDEDLFEMVGRGGCGPGGIGDYFVPDTILGISVYPACPPHDYDYTVGKTKEDKEQADLRLSRNLFRIVDIECPKALDPDKNKFATAMAQCYYLAVHKFGDDSFYRGKA